MIEEAPLRRAEAGLVPDGDGWFIVGVADAEGAHSERFGDGCVFEGPMVRFPEFGINVRVLEPGQPGSLYHREDAQEAFLVLSGECLAIVEDQERAMRKGDLLYTPPNTAHALVGAGERPCAILMVGSRKPSKSIGLPGQRGGGPLRSVGRPGDGRSARRLCGHRTPRAGDHRPALVAGYVNSVNTAATMKAAAQT